MPEDHVPHSPLIDHSEPPREGVVPPRHAASLVVYRGGGGGGTEVLMGMRGHKHRFMPNRLVFPGGAVDQADLSAPCASPLSPRTEHALRKNASAHLAHGLAIAAARELAEETGLSLGDPPHLGVLHYLGRAVTPPGGPIRFNARFLVVSAQHVSGEIGGDGELENLRYYRLEEVLQMELALPTRLVSERLRLWLGLNEAERAALPQVVLLRDQGWRAE